MSAASPIRIAAYRLPNTKEVVVVKQLTDNEASRGVVIAPFDKRHGKTLTIAADKLEHYADVDTIDDITVKEIDRVCDRIATNKAHETVDYEKYIEQFGLFHGEIKSGRFKKIVLARSMTIERPGDASAMTLFKQACHSYEGAFVMLSATAESGVRLTASPELLVETDSHGKAGSMALAGTMKAEDTSPWSAKDVEEQHLVEEFVKESFIHNCDTVSYTKPEEVKAGRLKHLQTEFQGRLKRDCDADVLAEALHPTPAVAGLPRDEAIEFIALHELTPRGYYAGYCGPKDIDGETHYYVTLRSMEIGQHHLMLQAGGGIMPESEADSEWRETESKMTTMINLLNV